MSVAQSGLSTINSLVFGIISVMLNIFLIYVVRKRAARLFGAYKHTMTACAVFDIIFSVVYIICSPTFAATPEKSALLIVNGGFEIPTTWGRSLIVVFVLLLCNSIVIPPCLFVFRYLQICRTSYLEHHLLRYSFIVPFLISSSICGMICFAAWPTESDIEYFTCIAYDINVEGNFTFLVASLQKDDTSSEKLRSDTLLAGTITVVVLLVVAMVTIILCARRITATVKKNNSIHTRRLDMQLRRTLFAQAASPFLLLHLPFYVSILGPLFEARTGEASNYFPFLFAWCPAINPFLTLCIVTDFRHFVLSLFKRKWLKTPSATVLRSNIVVFK
uniref:G_PROTEIN_RECEP_F1_2 domain-containing protein n=1 Tax=Haemonchus contortus TaxID=6289 RepID=A0A7I4YNQ2_HAECO